jgi:hemin uptake protein HemP
MFEHNQTNGAITTGIHPAHDAPARPSPPPRISSERLLGSGRDLVIEHAGQEYRLRLTRNDKLILTK